MIEITCVLRFHKSSLPKKKQLFHYWSTFRFGGMVTVDGYEFVGTFTHDDVLVYLHHNLPEWLWCDDVKKRGLLNALRWAKFEQDLGGKIGS